MQALSQLSYGPTRRPRILGQMPRSVNGLHIRSMNRLRRRCCTAMRSPARPRQQDFDTERGRVRVITVAERARASLEPRIPAGRAHARDRAARSPAYRHAGRALCRRPLPASRRCSRTARAACWMSRWIPTTRPTAGSTCPMRRIAAAARMRPPSCARGSSDDALEACTGHLPPAAGGRKSGAFRRADGIWPRWPAVHHPRRTIGAAVHRSCAIAGTIISARSSASNAMAEFRRTIRSLAAPGARPGDLVS